MLARIVVMSYVASSVTTSSSAAKTSSFVMMTSVCSLPMYSATSWAYFRSMASYFMPTANVRIGALSFFCAMAHTRDESSPPERRKPSFASDTRRFSTPATSLSCILAQTVSRSSRHTLSTCAMSQ